jgi:hypothetical protein
MAANFRTASIRDIKRLFTASPVPDAALRHGFFRASFVGPFWYRIGGFPSVHFSGLPYWQGKKFLTPDSATNILKQGNGMVQALSMTVVAGTSLIDGKPGVALHYGKEAPFPWRHVRDELRVIDERTLLGITKVNLPVLRNFAFPFLLERALNES